MLKQTEFTNHRRKQRFFTEVLSKKLLILDLVNNLQDKNFNNSFEAQTFWFFQFFHYKMLFELIFNLRFFLNKLELQTLF